MIPLIFGSMILAAIYFNSKKAIAAQTPSAVPTGTTPSGSTVMTNPVDDLVTFTESLAAQIAGSSSVSVPATTKGVPLYVAPALKHGPTYFSGASTGFIGRKTSAWASGQRAYAQRLSGRFTPAPATLAVNVGWVPAVRGPIPGRGRLAPVITGQQGNGAGPVPGNFGYTSGLSGGGPGGITRRIKVGKR